MAKAKKAGKGQRRDDQERKRDERARRNALRKENKSQSSLENDENFVSFSNQLEAQGLKIKEIIGDGNCLFRALGDQLDGDHNTHARHRQETVDFIRAHRQDFEPFMEDNISFEKHLQELSKCGNFGGNDSIVAFARNHGVNVIIHQLNEPRWVISGAEYSKTGQVIEIHISYHNGDHYSSVRSLFESDTSAPAWPNFKDKTVGSAGQLKPEGINKKGKKTKERRGVNKVKGLVGSAAEHKHHDETLAEQAVMEATGCKDLILVTQTLEENMYDTDLSISYILQMMCIAEEQGFATSELCIEEDQKESTHIGHTTEEDLADSFCSKNTENSSTCTSDTDISYGENNKTGDSPGSQNDTGGGVISLGSEDSSETCLDVRTDKEQNFPKNTETTKESHAEAHQPQGARPKVHGTSKPSPGQKNVSHLSNKKRKELAKQAKKKNRDERRKLTAEEGVTNCASAGTPSCVVPDLGALAI